jgi:hypothetical protein
MSSLSDHQATFQALIKRLFPYIDRDGLFRNSIAVHNKVYEVSLTNTNQNGIRVNLIHELFIHNKSSPS